MASYMRMKVPSFKSNPSQSKCGVTRLPCRDAPWRVRPPRCILLRHYFAANTDAPRRVPTRRAICVGNFRRSKAIPLRRNVARPISHVGTRRGASALCAAFSFALTSPQTRTRHILLRHCFAANTDAPRRVRTPRVRLSSDERHSFCGQQINRHTAARDADNGQPRPSTPRAVVIVWHNPSARRVQGSCQKGRPFPLEPCAVFP